jgi:hypothetical protein
MLFCDRQWRLAHLHRRPITLDALIALVQTIYDVRSQRRADPGIFPGPSLELLSLTNTADVPTGPAELLYLFVRTGMANLLNATPTSILILGNQRYCKRRPKTHPLAFVNEMPRMFSSSFFDSQGGAPPPPHTIVRRHDGAASETEIKVVGSLLHFGDLPTVANVKRSYGLLSAAKGRQPIVLGLKRVREMLSFCVFQSSI